MSFGPSSGDSTPMYRCTQVAAGEKAGAILALGALLLGEGNHQTGKLHVEVGGEPL